MATTELALPGPMGSCGGTVAHITPVGPMVSARAPTLQPGFAPEGSGSGKNCMAPAVVMRPITPAPLLKGGKPDRSVRPDGRGHSDAGGERARREGV